MAAQDSKKTPPDAPDAAQSAQPDDRLRQDRDGPRDAGRSGSNREFTSRDWEVANAPMDPERRRMFAEKWMSTHLPNLPLKDGWHRCWVATTHPTDTPARRIALGYRIVTLEDVKTAGWAPEAGSVKDGSAIDGAVRWREMIAMEVPMEDYLEYMKFFHHEQPREMAAAIYGGLEQTAAEVRDRGGRVEMGDGFQEMSRFRRAPRQFEG